LIFSRIGFYIFHQFSLLQIFIYNIEPYRGWVYKLSIDPTLIDITLRSILVSGTATLLASSWSIPIGILIGISDGRASRLLTSIFNILVGIPTVVVGLILYLILSRSGPLGLLNLLYTPIAISIGQAILITPIIVSFTIEVVNIGAREIVEMAKTFNARLTQIITTVLGEKSDRIIASSILGFQRAIGELAVALMIGGNIKGVTRVFTTAIALEVGRGEYELAIYLAIILLIIDFIIVILLRIMGWRE